MRKRRKGTEKWEVWRVNNEMRQEEYNESWCPKLRRT